MKKKVVILGAGGFIGSYLHQRFLVDDVYEVIPVYRNTLGLLSPIRVLEFLKAKTPNYIVNCVVEGATECRDVFTSTNSNILYNNWQIFSNFYKHDDLFDLCINIGSGAEFDITRDVTDAKEYQIFLRQPVTSYGIVKNMIARTIWKYEKYTNLRLFGCFGKHEKPYRLLKQFYNTETDKITISADRYFDFISIQDFYNVVRWVIKNDARGEDMNCVYPQKYKLSEVAELFKTVNNLDKPIEVTGNGPLNYTGDPCKLQNRVILEGIEQGMRDYVRD